MSNESTSTRRAASAREALEEERDFLLRSLRDLEAEREAGDIDEGDYVALRDDYTVRAARLLRRLDSPDGLEDEDLLDSLELLHAPECTDVVDSADAGDGAEDPDPEVGRGAPRRGGRKRRPWSRWQLAVVGLIVVLGAALVGWQIGHNSGTRQAGENITGDNATTPGTLSTAQVTQLLTQADQDAASNPVAAIKDYNEILKAYPDQPQALTDEGWILAQGDEISDAETLLAESERANPTYDPSYAYLGMVDFGQNNYSEAVSQLTYYLNHGPDPALKAEATKALGEAEVDAKATASPSTTKAP